VAVSPDEILKRRWVKQLIFSTRDENTTKGFQQNWRPFFVGEIQGQARQILRETPQ
jgi:hypothetical protein